MRTTKKKSQFLKANYQKKTFQSPCKLPGVSGDRELFNALFIFAIGVFNLFNYFTDPAATEGLLFAGILISVAIVIYLCPFRKSVLACLFLFLALMVHKDMTDPFGFSSASLFILAYSNMRKKGFGITIILFTILIIIYKSTVFNDNPSQVVMTVTLYTFLYINFWKIFKRTPKSINLLLKELTEEENELLNKLVSGMGQKEIGDKYKINRALRKIKDKLGKESLYEIIAIYSYSEGAKSCNKK